MSFVSFDFLVFLCITIVLYYFPLFQRFQILILILASLFFYGYTNPFLVVLLLFSVVINSLTTYHLLNKIQKQTIVILNVSFNLILLGTFKYAGFFGSLVLDSSSAILDFLLQIPLPIGISFFTFQSISLVMDLYRKELSQEQFSQQTGLLYLFQRVAFFISFFPQLVAGPIVKARDFFPQIQAKFFREIRWEYVFHHLTVGYFLKLVVANNLNPITKYIQYPIFETRSSVELVLLLFGYSAQIFADFAGYSSIAIGLSAIFGYYLPRNFNFPYIASSFSEFWRRWHISLSSFLRDYLYIPLGGNRTSAIRLYLNLMVVMALGGFWHGADSSYMVWGIYHGFLLCLERIAFDRVRSVGLFWKCMGWFFVITSVSLGWLLFKLTKFSEVILYAKAIERNILVSTDLRFISTILLFMSIIFIYHCFGFTKVKGFVENLWIRSTIYALLLFLIITNAGSDSAFIYFRF